MNLPDLKVGNEGKRFFTALGVVWLAYVVLSFMAPAAQVVSRYGLTLFQANLLRVSIVLPLFLIWLTAMYGVVKFRRYARLINESPESDGFRKITKGLWFLLAAVMVPSFINVIATYFPDSMMMQKAAIVIRNYLTIIFYMGGFVFLWQASKSLLRNIKAEEWGKKYRTYVLASVGILTFVYAYLIFQNPFRTISNDPVVLPTYHLPDVLITLTIIIPYFLIWLFGSMAVLNFLSYAKQAPGLIYKDTFDYVAQGLGITVALLIGLQFLTQANASLGHAALSVILIIVYVLLIAIAAGYFMIARGAKKLALIEEVE